MKVNEEIINTILTYLKEIDKVADKDTELFTTGILDSLDIIDLVLFLEKKYKLKIPQKSMTLENFGTPTAIGSLVLGILKS